MVTENNIKQYYNSYTVRQGETGVNERHQSILKKLLESGLKKNSQVLEIGCGIGTQSGLILKFLSQEGSLSSYDISNKSIDIAKETYAKYNNVKFVCADVTEIDIKGEYDIIVLPDVIEHIPIIKHDVLFSNLRKVLKSTGFMLINIPFANYLEWVHHNKPELLQIIDQPIYLDALSVVLRKNNYIIESIKTYSIYTKPYDYQTIVCKPWDNSMSFSNIDKKITLFDKIKYKLKHFGY